MGGTDDTDDTIEKWRGMNHKGHDTNQTRHDTEHCCTMNHLEAQQKLDRKSRNALGDPPAATKQGAWTPPDEWLYPDGGPGS